MTPYGHWSGAELEKRIEQTRSHISAYETIQLRMRDTIRIVEGESEGGDLFEDIGHAMQDFDADVDTAISSLREELEEMESEFSRRENRYYDRME